MTSWQRSGTRRYGPGPDYAKQAQIEAGIEKAHKRLLLKFRIAGIVTTLLGIGLIGLSIFTVFKCLIIGILAMCLGLAVLWATETNF
jgi:hypothetical protein